MENNEIKLPPKLADLNPETVKFLKDLNYDEIKEIKEAIEFYKKVSIVSKFFRWMIIGGIAAVITFSSFWDSVLKIKGLFFK